MWSFNPKVFLKWKKSITVWQNLPSTENVNIILSFHFQSEMSFEAMICYCIILKKNPYRMELLCLCKLNLIWWALVILHIHWGGFRVHKKKNQVCIDWNIYLVISLLTIYDLNKFSLLFRAALVFYLTPRIQL